MKQRRADVIELRQKSVLLGSLAVLHRYRQGLHEFARLTEHFAGIDSLPEKNHGLFREMILAEHVVDERAPTQLAQHEPDGARRETSSAVGSRLQLIEETSKHRKEPLIGLFLIQSVVVVRVPKVFSHLGVNSLRDVVLQHPQDALKSFGNDRLSLVRGPFFWSTRLNLAGALHEPRDPP